MIPQKSFAFRVSWLTTFNKMHILLNVARHMAILHRYGYPGLYESFTKEIAEHLAVSELVQIAVESARNLELS